MILASAVLSQTLVSQTETTDNDKQHIMGIAELAMQLQRSAKNCLYNHPSFDHPDRDNYFEFCGQTFYPN